MKPNIARDVSTTSTPAVPQINKPVVQHPGSIKIPKPAGSSVPPKGGEGGSLSPVANASEAAGSPPLPPSAPSIAREASDHSLPLTERGADGRLLIRAKRGEQHNIAYAAEKALADTGRYFQSGGQIVSLRTDTLTKDITVEPLSEPALMLALSDVAEWQSYDGRTKAWSRSDVPHRIVSALHRGQAYRHLPVITGLARQPYLSADGQLIAKAGYNADTGEFALFNGEAFTLPEPTKAEAALALTELSALIDECHFEGAADRSGALCAMLTAAVRSSLSVAPAFNISASASGSGKSHLAQVIGKFAGAGEAFNSSYPTSADEATKVLLSVGLRRPAVLCFDDMTTDWVAHGPINRFLTSETITDRMLGSNRMMSVSTRTLVLGTGNNVRPRMDLQRRVLTIYLNPAVETPSMHVYKTDPLAALRGNREQYVVHALTIVRAYLASDEPVSGIPPIGSFGQWSRFCREPLIWLGLTDPATSLIQQVQFDPDTAALGEILQALYDMFGSTPKPIRVIAPRLQDDDELTDFLDQLPVNEAGKINRSKLGWYFSRNANRVIGGYKLVQTPTSNRNAWQVLRLGADAFEPTPDRSATPAQLYTSVPIKRPMAEPDSDVY